jgi:hypothetical protein
LAAEFVAIIIPSMSWPTLMATAEENAAALWRRQPGRVMIDLIQSLQDGVGGRLGVSVSIMPQFGSHNLVGFGES